MQLNDLLKCTFCGKTKQKKTNKQTKKQNIIYRNITKPKVNKIVNLRERESERENESGT